MKAGRLAMMVTALGLTALPASLLAAPAEAPQDAALSADALPLTPRFASLLTSYRNCVLRQVDEGMLGDQRDMAHAAMSACALARGELRAQLLADIGSQQPGLSTAAVTTTAETGLAQLDPMIEAVAIDQAHMRYARTMY